MSIINQQQAVRSTIDQFASNGVTKDKRAGLRPNDGAGVSTRLYAKQKSEDKPKITDQPRTQFERHKKAVQLKQQLVKSFSLAYDPVIKNAFERHRTIELDSYSAKCFQKSPSYLELQHALKKGDELVKLKQQVQELHTDFLECKDYIKNPLDRLAVHQKLSNAMQAIREGDLETAKQQIDTRVLNTIGHASAMEKQARPKIDSNSNSSNSEIAKPKTKQDAFEQYRDLRERCHEVIKAQQMPRNLEVKINDVLDRAAVELGKGNYQNAIDILQADIPGMEYITLDDLLEDLECPEDKIRDKFHSLLKEFNKTKDSMLDWEAKAVGHQLWYAKQAMKSGNFNKAAQLLTQRIPGHFGSIEQLLKKYEITIAPLQLDPNPNFEPSPAPSPKVEIPPNYFQQKANQYPINGYQPSMVKQHPQMNFTGRIPANYGPNKNVITQNVVYGPNGPPMQYANGYYPNYYNHAPAMNHMLGYQQNWRQNYMPQQDAWNQYPNQMNYSNQNSLGWRQGMQAHQQQWNAQMRYWPQQEQTQNQQITWQQAQIKMQQEYNARKLEQLMKQFPPPNDDHKPDIGDEDSFDIPDDTSITAPPKDYFRNLNRNDSTSSMRSNDSSIFTQDRDD